MHQPGAHDKNRNQKTLIATRLDAIVRVFKFNPIGLCLDISMIILSIFPFIFIVYVLIKGTYELQ